MTIAASSHLGSSVFERVICKDHRAIKKNEWAHKHTTQHRADAVIHPRPAVTAHFVRAVTGTALSFPNQRGRKFFARKRGWIALRYMSTPTLSIATWNLERSGAHHRCRMPAQVDRMKEHASDIWILTETHDDIAPPGCPHSVGSQTNPQWQAPGERLVSIWSRFPLSPVRTTDPACTAAAYLRPPGFARPLLVCGTVVNCEYDSEQRQHRSAANVAAVANRLREWKRLVASHSSDDLCFVCDFNTALRDTQSNGANVTQEALLSNLKESRLRCLNNEYLNQGQPGVHLGGASHIFYSDLPGLTAELTSWSGGAGSLRPSGHNGLRVDLTRL